MSESEKNKPATKGDLSVVAGDVRVLKDQFQRLDGKVDNIWAAVVQGWERTDRSIESLAAQMNQGFRSVNGLPKASMAFMISEWRPGLRSSFWATIK